MRAKYSAVALQYCDGFELAQNTSFTAALRTIAASSSDDLPASAPLGGGALALIKT
jgi:hypothetical protein